MRQFGVGVLVLVSLLLAPRVTSAQAIAGVVTDTSGAILPGVTVEARSPALTEQRTVFTDGSGLYEIVSLRPGTYSVTFTLPGFSVIVREGIELTTGFTAKVDAQLRVGTVQETVTVTGASPLVDVQNVTQRQVATRDIIDTVPVAKSFQALGVLIPGVTTGGSTNNQTQDVGGQSGQSHMTLAIHGGRTSDQHVSVDGLNVESMNRADSAGPWLPDATFQEIAFSYSANTAETETGGVRINQIPAEGGNTFHGGAFYGVSPPSWQGSNFDDQLRALGVSGSNRVKENWQAEVKLGGPIIRDRMWFFLSHGWFRADEYVLGTFYNKDQRARTFVPDLTQQATSLQGPNYTTTARVNWQATPRNRITGYITTGDQKYPIWLPGLLGTTTRAPEASINTHARNDIYQASYSSPVTSRLLFEGGLSHNPQKVNWPGQPWAANDLPGILDASTLTYFRNTGAYWLATDRSSPYKSWSFRGAVSYVTGSHAFKAGLSGMHSLHSVSDDFPGAQNGPMSYLTFNGTPLSVTYYATPDYKQYGMNNVGFFGQDQWRVSRLTVSAGVRLDYLQNYNLPISVNPSQFVPVARSYPWQEAVSWKDLSPRLGIAWDPFGDGKTAVKASANRYVLRAWNQYAVNINPLNTNYSNTRAWTDTNNNFFPDGDPLNPNTNGELGASSNRDFSNPHINAFYDPAFAFGYGHRPSDWEFSTSLQRELREGLSANVSYFRRVYTNFEVQNNRAVSAADYDFFCVTAPSNAALPNGGGQQICGIPDLKPGKVGLLDNITTSADNLGTRTQHWNGVDATVQARLRSVLLQGGLNVGKTSVDECALTSVAPEASYVSASNRIPTQYCNNISVSSQALGSLLGGVTTPWQTQVKLLGSYTFPFEILASATYQTLPGPMRTANVTFGNAATEGLNRPLSQGSVLVNVITPGTEYADRLHQLDLRATKIFRFGVNRLRANLDVYNALNNNAPLNFPAAFNPANPVLWQRPGVIMPARLAKFSFQYDF
jgi:hypothetical protein